MPRLYCVSDCVSVLEDGIISSNSSLVNKEYLKLESKEKRKFVLYKVKYCRYYRNKLKNKNRYNHHLGKQQRKLFSCLRLHIVPNDGDADGKLIMIA